jgi:hypothetical protein
MTGVIVNAVRLAATSPSLNTQGDHAMATITTQDGTQIY